MIGSTVRDTLGGTYQVVCELDSGGQGVVYEALDIARNARCVVKCLHACHATPQAAARLQALTRLQLGSRSSMLCAPSVCLAGAVGAVQPFALGNSLETLFSDEDYDLFDGLGMAAALCRALAVLEALGVAHGDLAASNVMAHRVDGEAFHRLTLIDFDNALIPGAPAPAFRGQDFYSAPELLTNARTTSLESDRFALGVLLHELLYGRHPFASALPAGSAFKSYVALIQKCGWLDDPTLGRGAPPADGIPVGTLSHHLQGLFRRALRPEPSARPCAVEWVSAFEEALREMYLCDGCNQYFVNEAQRVRCPHCARAPRTFVLEAAGRVMPLDRTVTTIGRFDLGGDPSVSRSHAVIRRRGFGLRIRNTSLNGLALRGTSQWVELAANDEADLAAGDRIRFAPGLEGVIREARL